MKRLSTNYHYILLAGLILVITFFHLSWIQEDGRYQPFVDPYPEHALDIVDHLASQGFRQLSTMIEETRLRARSPLYPFGLALFVLGFGRSVDAMLGFNLIMNALLIVGAYFAGNLVKNRTAGLLAALVVATLAPLVNLTRLARPHAVLPAVVMWWLLFGLLMLKNRSLRTVWALCLILVFGFWLHPNVFYLLVVPTLLFTIQAIFSIDEIEAEAGSRGTSTNISMRQQLMMVARWGWPKINCPFVWKGVLPGFLMVVLLTAAWYLHVWEDVTELAQESAENWNTVRYGFNHIEASFWWYLWTFPGAISIFFAAVFFASLTINLFTRQRYPFILSLTFILMYLGMGLREGTLAWMNFAAVLPVVGLITAVFLDDLFEVVRKEPIQWLNRANPPRVDQLFASLLIISAIILAIFNFYMVTGKVPERAKHFAQTLGAPLESACGWRMNVAYCPNPPLDQNWQERKILQAIINASGCLEDPCSVAIVTESAEIFSFSSIRYFLAQEFPEVAMKIVPIRTQNLHSIDWLTTDFLVYIPQLQNNEYANSVIAFLGNPTEDFAEIYHVVEQIPLPRGWDVRIVKRTRLLNEQEIYQFVDALDMPADFKASLTLDFTFRGMDE